MSFSSFIMRVQVVAVMIILTAFHAHAMTLGEKLDGLSSMLDAEILVEDSITGDPAGPLPGNAARLSQEDLVRSALNGYSFSTLYKGERISRIWVYKNGTGKYSRVAGRARAATQPTLSSRDITVRSQSRESVRPASAAHYVTPVSYRPGVKRSANGYYFRENAFGFRKAISTSDPFRETGRISTGKNPTTGGATGGLAIGDYGVYRQVSREAQDERNMAMSAMMLQARTKARIR
jgi:hypothetical protein